MFLPWVVVLDRYVGTLNLKVAEAKLRSTAHEPSRDLRLKGHSSRLDPRPVVPDPLDGLGLGDRVPEEEGQVPPVADFGPSEAWPAGDFEGFEVNFSGEERGLI